MIKKKTLQTSSDAKRDEIAQETEVFLKAGREINQIPYGVSGLDPMGRGKPTTHGQHKKNSALQLCLRQILIDDSCVRSCFSALSGLP